MLLAYGVKSVTIVGYGVLDAFHDSIRKDVTRQPLVVTIHYGEEFKVYESGIFRGPCGKEFIFNNGSTQLEVLSPQTLIDCDTLNNGCFAGDIRKAFLFATRSPGLLREDDYPYIAVKRPCMLPADGVKSVTIVGYGVLDAFHDSIRKAVTRQPPVVTIHYGEEFKVYESGIFRGPCGKGKHSLLLVGYGTTDQGEKYWILKNSWSRLWGEEGYVRMLNNETQSGLCGMNTRVAFPIPLGAF
ncbi:ervatamin-B-like [Trifolium pratense]|uniref:ervatamin-B-like n=1 Tax=Trifolium pratense TaxID=57577 RepID=UPI001E6938FD|nr:ervatamin-B-like [Trifolium pratense]